MPLHSSVFFRLGKYKTPFISWLMKLVGYWFQSENYLTNLSVISVIRTKWVVVSRETRIIYLIVQRPLDNLCRKRQYPKTIS